MPSSKTSSHEEKTIDQTRSYNEDSNDEGLNNIKKNSGADLCRIEVDIFENDDIEQEKKKKKKQQMTLWVSNNDSGFYKLTPAAEKMAERLVDAMRRQQIQEALLEDIAGIFVTSSNVTPK